MLHALRISTLIILAFHFLLIRSRVIIHHLPSGHPIIRLPRQLECHTIVEMDFSVK
jgi:hypothetical protein